MSRHCCTPCYG